MDALGLSGTIALALVLVVSGVAKLRDLGASRASMAALGIPGAAVVGTLAPLVEGTLAALLLPPPTSRATAAAALVFLLLASAALIPALRRPDPPACACFGALSTAPVSTRTLWRNGLLGVLALCALVVPRDPPDVGTWVGSAVAGVVIAAAVLLWERAEGGRHSRRARPVGDLVLRSLTGDDVQLAAVDRPMLLAYLNPGCGPCQHVAPLLRAWADVLHEELRVLVVTSASADDVRSEASFSGLEVLLDPDQVALSALGLHWSPSGVVLGVKGAGAVAQGATGLRGLLPIALGEPPADPSCGWRAADDLTLTDVVGRGVSVTARSTHDAGLVLVDRASGAAAEVDRIGAVVWDALDPSTSLAELADDLAEAFAASVERVGEDVLATARTLGAAGLLYGVRPAPDDPAINEVNAISAPAAPKGPP